MDRRSFIKSASAFAISFCGMFELFKSWKHDSRYQQVNADSLHENIFAYTGEVINKDTVITISGTNQHGEMVSSSVTFKTSEPIGTIKKFEPHISVFGEIYAKAHRNGKEVYQDSMFIISTIP